MKIRFAALLGVCLGAFLMLGGGPAAWGQAAAGRVIGNVYDQQGAVVPGAKVTVANTGTQASSTTITDKDGYFQELDLPIGQYAVTVEREGFKKYVTTPTKLLINQSLRFDVKLELGTSNQSITVEGQAAQVETVDPTLGQSVTSRQLVNLPLNGRNVLNLALLQPGVTEADDDYAGAGNFSIAGGRPDSVTFLLDGGLNNELQFNGVVLNPNPDTVAEFRILTSDYTAEYGRNGAGVISVVTKSGTNQIHGSAFEFDRNTDFNANTYFNKIEGLPRNDLKRHQFGATLGGPITIPHVIEGKDRFFFFLGYQGQRQTTAAVESDVATFTSEQLGGDFTGDPGVTAFLQANPYFAKYPGSTNPAQDGIIDPAKFNTASTNFIALGLIPTSETGLVSTAATGTNNDNELTGKLDFVISPKDKLAVTLGESRGTTLTPFVHADVPGFPELGSTDNYFGSVTYTKTYSPTLLNEFRVTPQRQLATQDVPGFKLPTAAALGFGVTPDLALGPPDLNFDSGLAFGPSVQGPTTFASTTYSFSDTLTWIRGRNTWKFGAGFLDFQNNTVFDFFGSGEFFFSGGTGVGTGNSFADFLLGIPTSFTEGPNAHNNIRSKATYAFLQDEWRVRSNLVLTLGLRYEYSTPKLDTQGRTFSIIPGFQSTRFVNAPVGLAFPGDLGAPKGVNFPDKRNLAPRVGFAWDPSNNGKTSVRGGFGIFYDVLKGEDNLQFNGATPFYSDGSANGGNPYPTVTQGDTTTCCPVPYFSDPWLTAQGGVDPFPSTPPSTNINFVQAGFLPWNSSFSLFAVDPHLHTPYTYQYNLSVQHEVAKNLVAEVSYVGSSSKGLTGLVDTNPMVLGTFNRVLNLTPQTNAGIINFCADDDAGECPFIELPEFQNVGFASYNSLEASLTKQVGASRIFGTTYFTLAYTYGRSIDTNSGFENRNSFVPAYNIQQFRAPSDSDVTHRITFSGGWDLPFDQAWGSGPKWLLKGWSVYPILTWRTGFPLGVNSNYDDGFFTNDDPGPSADGDPGLVQALFAPGVTKLQMVNPKNVTDYTGSGFLAGNYYFNPNDFAGALQGFTPQYTPFNSSSGTGTPCSQQVITNILPSSDCAVANPSLRTFGLPRNFFRGPGLTNLDIALAKTTPIGEHVKAELRLEAFNVFNHAEFANPDTGIVDFTFGQITSTRDPRILQLALRITF
jgi:Carboxypeptidase regulatory-like domain/TonB-dependent Receptor Plug Domain